MEELISIIIPVYNAEKYIERTLNSIKEQTYSNYEIIIINDGSTDESVKICNDFKKKNNNIKITVITQKNSGVSNARNSGICLSKGKYIIFVDSDDSLEKNMLKDLSDSIKIADLVISGYWWDINGHTNSKSHISCNVDKSNIIELFEKGFINQLWNKIYVSDIIKKNNIRFDENLKVAEDLDFNLRYISYCNGDILFLDRYVYKYYIRNSRSQQKN